MTSSQPITDSSDARNPTETSPLLGSNPKNTSQENATDTEAAQHPSHNNTAGDDDTALVEEPSQVKFAIIVIAIWTGVFLAAMDSTIVATLATPISNEFNSVSLLSWLASGYLISNAGFQPISGKLTDIFGRRAGLVFANIFFMAGNLICGLARSESVMILGRLVAGIGGGCLNTVSTFIITDIVPLRRRGIWQGVGNICFGVGAGVGGVIGGAINDALGDWRWAFLLQVPLSALSCIVVFFVINIPIKETAENKIRRVDFLGAFTLVTSLVLLVLGLNSGGNIVPWNHPLVYVPIPLSIVILCVFIYVEDRIAAEPIMPVRLLLHRTVAAGCLTNWFATMAYFAYIFYGQLYFQSAKGLSATDAGIRLIPNAVGIAVGSMGSGVLMRITGTYYALNALIEGIFILAAALMVGVFNVGMPDWPSYIIFFLAGLGYGSMLTITLLALISAVEHKHQAVITSASYAARATGSVIGIAIASAVFQNELKQRLGEEFKGIKNADKIIRQLRDNIENIKKLPEGLQMRAIIAFMDALRGVWITILILATLGGICSLFMRQHTLHNNLARK